jgi:hypothetical protein
MNFITIMLASFCITFCLSCSKESSGRYKAEGYVYFTNTTTPVGNVPVVMSECHHTGTRCVYTFVTKTHTDANGYYSISESGNNRGALSIEVGYNDQTFGSGSVILVNPNKIIRHDFYVDAARYVTARFIVQPQNRNYALLSIKSGYYSAVSAIFRDATNTIDTTLKFKYAAGNPVTLNVLLQNKNTVPPINSDSLLYSKHLGIPANDTSLVWIVP